MKEINDGEKMMRSREKEKKRGDEQAKERMRDDSWEVVDEKRMGDRRAARERYLGIKVSTMFDKELTYGSMTLNCRSVKGCLEEMRNERQQGRGGRQSREKEKQKADEKKRKTVEWEEGKSNERKQGKKSEKRKKSSTH
jgi:hypothetical protein